MTLKELIREVVEVQDACNLAGVLYSAHRAACELRRLMPEYSTDEINKHVIMRAYASKIGDLSRNWNSDYPHDELCLLSDEISRKEARNDQTKATQA